ncbi:MAG TPA: membrane protein insertase YidC [Vicinamibacterales bacterium]|jgi:YidC/Oxa1 family membrane protein insertase
MERRYLLALFLCFLVLYVYQLLLPKPPQAPTQTAKGKPQVTQNQQVEAETPRKETPLPSPEENASPPLVAETMERDVPLETDLVSAVFSNRGAVIKSWKLKNFRDASNQPHDLIPSGVPADLPRPFSLRLEDQATARRLNSALFKVDVVSPSHLRFEYQDASGLKARKEFQLPPGSYVLMADVTVNVGGAAVAPVVQWGPGLGPLTTTENQSSYVQRSAGILYANDEVTRLDAGAIAEQPTHMGPFGFTGVDDQYFLLALVRPSVTKVSYRTVSVPAPLGGEARAELVSYEAQLSQTPGAQRVFIGPKDFDVLRAVDQDLVRAINFGWFAWLVVPLLTSLKMVNGFVGNYGWSIIILTILINALMFPLRHKSVVSMRKMQEIQPEVKAIQDRYAKLKATDPARQKMNTEMMALYRERGVNPASGCIPMLLTMPVLFAFYQLLSVAIELRGAPFAGWIKDLSAHDPLYVTPILMGATMFIQQKMSPATLDPVQQKMMMIMPVVFTFMFLQAPSGLVLYWFVSNLWTIGQQMVTNRLIGPPNVRMVRPPAERKLKKAGAGKTEAAEKTEP